MRQGARKSEATDVLLRRICTMKNNASQKTEQWAKGERKESSFRACYVRCSLTTSFPHKKKSVLRGLTSRKECCRYLAQNALSRHLAAGNDTLPIPWNTLATALASMGTSYFF